MVFSRRVELYRSKLTDFQSGRRLANALKSNPEQLKATRLFDSFNSWVWIGSTNPNRPKPAARHNAKHNNAIKLTSCSASFLEFVHCNVAAYRCVMLQYVLYGEIVDIVVGFEPPSKSETLYGKTKKRKPESNSEIQGLERLRLRTWSSAATPSYTARSSLIFKEGGSWQMPWNRAQDDKNPW